SHFLTGCEAGCDGLVIGFTGADFVGIPRRSIGSGIFLVVSVPLLIGTSLLCSKCVVGGKTFTTCEVFGKLDIGKGTGGTCGVAVLETRNTNAPKIPINNAPPAQIFRLSTRLTKGIVSNLLPARCIALGCQLVNSSSTMQIHRSCVLKLK